MYNIKDSTLVCIGDIHGEFPTLRYMVSNYLQKYNLTNVTFVVCGDCGFFGSGTNENKWRQFERIKLDNVLVDANSHLYFFRGNHDNPELFTEKYIVGDDDLVKNIHVLRDYDLLDSKVYGTILIVPGAFSVDRVYRKKGVDWFEGEEPVRLPVKSLLALPKVDMILSHSLPYFDETHGGGNDLSSFCKKDVESGRFDDTIYDRIKSVTDYLRNVQCAVHANLWISGHYHLSSTYDYESARFVTLGINEFYNVNYDKEAIRKISCPE